MNDVLAMLETAGIDHHTHVHPPVFTVEEAQSHWADIDAQHTKNLFLKDAGGQFWLIAMPADKPLDLKSLPLRIGSKRLRFAPADQLFDILGITAGSVSPLALVNDAARQANLVLDAALMAAPRIAFHPLDNARTTVLTPAGLQQFLTLIDRTATITPL